jgi:hypothetical protein
VRLAPWVPGGVSATCGRVFLNCGRRRPPEHKARGRAFSTTPKLLCRRFPKTNRLAFFPKKGRHAEESPDEGLIDQILRRQSETSRLLTEPELHAGQTMPAPVTQVRACQPIPLPEIKGEIEERHLGIFKCLGGLMLPCERDGRLVSRCLTRGWFHRVRP